MRKPKAVKSSVRKVTTEKQKDQTPLESYSPDPRAPNDCRKISLSMNRYTYELLQEAADIEQRSLVQTMRFAIQKYAKDVIKENS